jgi:hypothetical protein
MKKAITVFMIIAMFVNCNDVAAKQVRSRQAKKDFKRLHPCPSTGKIKGRCDGYVIDHIKPLACGGDDLPSNMQWQTVEDGKAKDRWERKDCSIYF